MSSDFDRPNPEELLRAIQKTETVGKHGRLKIYLGMAAGVGKTFSMLEDAQRLHQLGTHVVVGSVETHGRTETARLLEGLTIVPERWIEYRGTPFRELDIDEILKLNPTLVIVDELAHSNVPGSRHPKRWQDVEEILDRGIDVFTTLNVQHIESLKDAVEGITGIPVTEAVPDSVIEKATYIELIDLTPFELLQRLKEGKVYLGPQAEIAIAHFFQEDRLTALREMALRFAAEKVDHDLRGMVSSVEREEAWKPRERILVIVNESPKNQKMIRVARRLSFALNAPWIALHVDDGRDLTDIDKTTLGKNIALARDLGAEVITTHDPQLTNAIERIARQKGVTQVVLGRGPKSKLFGLFPQPSFVEQILEACADLDIHVIRHAGMSGRIKQSLKFYPQNWPPYLVVSIIIGLLSGFNVLVEVWLGYKAVGFIYLVGILLLSLYFRRGPILFASILAGAIWYYFFIPPMDLVNGSTSEDVALLVLFLLTAIFTGILTDRARKNQEMLAKREETAEALYEITRNIATATSQKELRETVSRRLGRALDGDCKTILKAIEDDELHFEREKETYKDPKQQAAIEWVFENEKEAGWSTTTLPLENALYLPLKNPVESFGVLIFKPHQDKELDLEDKNFLLTVCQLLTNAIEKAFVEERKRKEEAIRQTEKVYQTVLDLLSAKFANPLQVLQATVGELKGADDKLGKRLIYRIEDTSDGLIQDIENISSMVKLSSGDFTVVKVPNDVHKLVDACFNRVKKIVGRHKVKITIPVDLPLIPFDYALMQILLTNLLANGIQNSPDGSTIEIKVQLTKKSFLLFEVLDEGKGIPEDMLEAVFKKFTRLPGSAQVGLGLGLSIARAIAEAHGGTLRAENRPTGGTIFSLTLPL